jgi:hypothetical protein
MVIFKKNHTKKQFYGGRAKQDTKLNYRTIPFDRKYKHVMDKHLSFFQSRIIVLHPDAVKKQEIACRQYAFHECQAVASPGLK